MSHSRLIPFLVFAALIAPAGAFPSEAASLLKAHFLKGYRYGLQGSHERALSHLSVIRDLDAGMRDYVLFYLGRELMESGRCGEAASVFQELTEKYPDSRWSSSEAGALRQNEKCPSPVPAVRPPQGSDCSDIPSPAEKADCYFARKQYGQAKEIYRRLGLGLGSAHLTRLSQSAARSQDFETALWANRALRERYPGTAIAREAHRKIAFLHQDSGNYKEAIPVLQDLASTARHPHERRPYLERIAWCHFRLGNYPEAVGGFDAALSEGETPFSLYWKGRSLERMEKKGEGKDLFRSVAEIYPGSYYGLRALERLFRSPLSLNDWWPQVPGGLRWRRTVESAEDSPELLRIQELTWLGLFADAEIEIRRLRARSGLPLPSDSKKLKRKGDKFIHERRLVEVESQDYLLPHADSLFAGMKRSQSGLDPFLLYGMMRQESRFRESVVSPAGAVGLLQIMPGTAQKLARESGWGAYQNGWLYDPVTNIELAVRYLRKLSGLFEGKWYAVAASYNAGEGVVSEWLRRKPGLPEEEFIEEIPYQETREYVKKVYTNWKAYRFIYGVDK